jgi:hypothetical protein
MKTEQRQLKEMFLRVRQVFPELEWSDLSLQQQMLIDKAIHYVADKEGFDALTLPRLFAIKGQLVAFRP